MMISRMTSEENEAKDEDEVTKQTKHGGTRIEKNVKPGDGLFREGGERAEAKARRAKNDANEAKVDQMSKQESCPIESKKKKRNGKMTKNPLIKMSMEKTRDNFRSNIFSNETKKNEKLINCRKKMSFQFERRMATAFDRAINLIETNHVL